MTRRKPSLATRCLAATLCLSILLAGCASSQKATTIKLPTYQPAPLKPPIEERPEVKLPAKTGAPTPLLQCGPPKCRRDDTTKKWVCDAQPTCSVKFSGILIDGHLAARYKLQAAERDKLRAIIATDRQAYSASHKVVESAFNDLAKQAERSWWERNKGTFGFWGGMVIGMGFAILAVWAGTKAASEGAK